MKKRILSVFCGLAVLSMMLFTSFTEADASDVQIVDGSYLTQEESATGTTGSPLTRGEHLMDGECSISKAGVGRIYVYAGTTANHDVDYISAILYIDQYDEETGEWFQIDYMLTEASNTYFAVASGSRKVDRGYYYRVHADHFAGMEGDILMDEATSFTDGIWVG